MKLINMFNNIEEKINEAPVSRRQAFNKAGELGIKTLLASLPFALGATLLPKKSYAQSATIIEVLNFALTLEYLESKFYVTGLAAPSLIPAGDRTVFMQISKHETAHVAALRATITSLGGTPVAEPTFDFTAGGAFPTVFSIYSTFITIAQAFEDTGVRAYKGQAGNLISNDAVLTAALQIHSVEARHASEVRRIRGQKGWIVNSDPGGAPPAIYTNENNLIQGGVNISTFVSAQAATEAFDEPLTMAEVLAIVGPFIV
ncbi:MAG: ferritin-like domain-containing protein [Ignavibacteria bacterium]